MYQIDNNINNEQLSEILKFKIKKQNELKSRIKNAMKELKQIKNYRKNRRKLGKKVEETNYIHLTEKDAKLMKKNGSYISGYNGQALVDSKKNMIITN